jgi:hypothetical protein
VAHAAGRAVGEDGVDVHCVEGGDEGEGGAFLGGYHFFCLLLLFFFYSIEVVFGFVACYCVLDGVVH